MKMFYVRIDRDERTSGDGACFDYSLGPGNKTGGGKGMRSGDGRGDKHGCGDPALYWTGNGWGDGVSAGMSQLKIEEVR